jgi:hypothetical protein
MEQLVMHSYSITINDKVKVYWIIIPLSLFTGYFVNEGLKTFSFYQTYSWIIDIPSSGLAFYAFYYQLFDKFVWKWFAQLNFWFKTPVLCGEYTGELLSSRDDMKEPTEITIKIKQTLTRIKISLHTSQSTSKSEMASIFVDEPDGPLLIYEFINDHRKVADSNLTIHRGTTRLTFDQENKTLIGTYYTSPERRNYGQISVKGQ